MRRSLRLRLLVVGAFAIVVTLWGAALGLALLFERHVERVAVGDLEARAQTLAGIVEHDAEGVPRLAAPPPDRLYQQPFSGHYWQVALGSDVQRSRSLWDYSLPMDRAAPPPGRTEVLDLPGPQGNACWPWSKACWWDAAHKPFPADHRCLGPGGADGGAAGFPGRPHAIPGLPGPAAGHRVLAADPHRPVAPGRGRGPREGADPGAAVADRHRLARRDAAPVAATGRASGRPRCRTAARAAPGGDLAHGFKTPLQALLGDAGTLRGRGEPEIAGSIETVVTSMRRLVERELTRARIQSDRHAAEADPAAVLARLVKVLKRTPKGGTIDWQTRVDDPAPRARIDPDDLTEALGALLENAMHHADAVVEAVVTRQGSRVRIAICDDGPGVPDTALASLPQRGMRLDESGDGQGIGLAIVSDIAEAAGAT
ncbi:sensor histidine kinase [Paracoccus aerius]